MEKRTRKVEDVAKRAQFRKAHGLDQSHSFGGWTAKTDEESLGPAIGIEGANEAADGVEEPARVRRPIKKWFGIW